MKSVIKKYELIFCEVDSNKNKYWRGLLYDDGTGASEFGRVGYDAQTCEYPSHRIVEQKMRGKITKGYTELKTISNITSSLGSGNNNAVRNSDLQTIAKSQLIKSSNPILEKLIKRFVDANVHKITANTQITYNSTTGLFATPLGIVEQTGLDEARDLLAQIAPMVRTHNFGMSADTIISKYLRLIPQHLGMGKFSAKSIIPDDNALQKQLDLITSLESSYQALQTAVPISPDNASDKPQEQVFKVDLDVLNDSSEIDRITQWFNTSNRATHGYSHVKIINYLKLKIHDNWNNFNEKLGNLKETWHGTSESNLLSILKVGLKVSPPSTTHITGKMFGGGHYGALDSSKSMQYTFGKFGGSRGTSGWLAVIDFAMGNTYYIKSYGGSIPRGYDSIWAKKENTGLRFDELIVPRDNQVRIKYLLELK